MEDKKRGGLKSTPIDTQNYRDFRFWIFTPPFRHAKPRPSIMLLVSQFCSGTNFVSPRLFELLPAFNVVVVGGVGVLALLLAACNLWSNAFNAIARLRSASALVLPPIPLPPDGPPPLMSMEFKLKSPPAATWRLLLAEISSAEKGVQILIAHKTLYTASEIMATGRWIGSGKKLAREKVSDASPLIIGDSVDPRSGYDAL